MKLVADANVLLSAVLGGRAKQVLTHPVIEEIFTTAVTFAEVQEYTAVLALHLGAPLWSNDNDFSESGIEWYTTDELLQELGTRRGR